MTIAKTTRPDRPSFGLLAVSWVALASACDRAPAPLVKARAHASPSSPSAVAPANVRAEELDQSGKLAAALPLYAARARLTNGDADRLKYAGALLRAGREEPAVRLLDGMAHETSDGEAEERRTKAGVVVSSLLASGFPSLAARYAEGMTTSGSDPRSKLLLLRARIAAADFGSAKALANDLLAASGAWPPGPRYELARSFIAAGVSQPADELLAEKSTEAVGEMFRHSVLANLSLVHAEWGRAERLLADSEKALPVDFGGHVSREWRNAKRELASVRLRRAVALSFLGKRAESMAEARRAKSSDEEPVHAGATLVLAAMLVADDKRAEAAAVLTELSGHDPRFEPSIAALRPAVVNGTITRELVAPIERVLYAEDASLGFVAEDVCRIFTSGAAAPAPVPTYAAAR